MAETQRWTQAELKRCPGAEVWFLVRHRSGSFWLPQSASVADVYEGVREGWGGKTRPRHPTTGRVTIAVEELMRLQLLAQIGKKHLED